MGKNICSGIRRNSTLKELDIADEDDMNNSGWRRILLLCLVQNAGWKRFDWIILQMMLLHSYLPNVLLQNSATLKTLCLIGSHDAMTADFFHFF